MGVLDRYTVIKTEDEKFPYELHGPRGARYALMRNVPNPHMLFAVNARRSVVDGAAALVHRQGRHAER
jgi:hypothetical protein